MSLPFRVRPPSFESVIDFHATRLMNQCRDPKGAELFIADHVSDPAELLMAVLHELAHCEDDAQLGVSVREILEQEIRKAAYWCAERTAEREDVTV